MKEYGLEGWVNDRTCGSWHPAMSIPPGTPSHTNATHLHLIFTGGNLGWLLLILALPPPLPTHLMSL